MKENLCLRNLQSKFHNNDAFVRIGILQFKIKHKSKTDSLLMNEIQKIHTWKIQPKKNYLFVQRVRRFANNIGCSMILTLCLQKFLTLFQSNPHQEKIPILYLICQYRQFLAQYQLLAYLNQAIVIMGANIQKFNEIGFYFSVQFCKLTEAEAQFYTIFKRSTQKLQQMIISDLFGRSKNQQVQNYIFYESRNNQAQIFQQNYKNNKLKPNEIIFLKHLLQLYLIGSIKCLEQNQRAEYKRRAHLLIVRLQHYDNKQIQKYLKHMKNLCFCTTQKTILSKQRIKKLGLRHPNYQINLQKNNKKINIQPIIFRNKKPAILKQPSKSSLYQPQPNSSLNKSSSHLKFSSLQTKYFQFLIQFQNTNNLKENSSKSSQYKVQEKFKNDPLVNYKRKVDTEETANDRFEQEIKYSTKQNNRIALDLQQDKSQVYFFKTTHNQASNKQDDPYEQNSLIKRVDSETEQQTSQKQLKQPDATFPLEQKQETQKSQKLKQVIKDEEKQQLNQKQKKQKNYFKCTNSYQLIQNQLQTGKQLFPQQQNRIENNQCAKQNKFHKFQQCQQSQVQTLIQNQNIQQKKLQNNNVPKQQFMSVGSDEIFGSQNQQNIKENSRKLILTGQKQGQQNQLQQNVCISQLEIENEINDLNILNSVPNIQKKKVFSQNKQKKSKKSSFLFRLKQNNSLSLKENKLFVKSKTNF